MGLKSIIQNSFTIVLISVTVSQAAWIGPSEVVSGTWGDGIGQFSIKRGDTSAIFPTTIDVSSTGLIAISEDQTLERVQVFNVNGQPKFAINTFAYTLIYSREGTLYISGGGRLSAIVS